MSMLYWFLFLFVCFSCGYWGSHISRYGINREAFRSAGWTWIVVGLATAMFLTLLSSR